MSAQHITKDTRFECAQIAIGRRMADSLWMNEAWGTQVDCDAVSRQMCEAMADGDDAQAIAILRNALSAVAEREASAIYGVFL
ncbi:MAG TPA: hypothetical protein VM621_10395 [Luteibacter sp.]|uniref:hypothetical protein n=1 Tax=Luteibacter sp. TaxID=1886636 RepID=UPI002B97EDDE|nr:hypothetical protein [Luteibacter sp.]HVI55448.1 hypothetical protein [Luteibacter sp.]